MQKWQENTIVERAEVDRFLGVRRARKRPRLSAVFNSRTMEHS